MEETTAPNKVCQWWLWNEEANTWTSSCFAHLTLPHRTPKWHGLDRCPSCGGKVIEADPDKAIGEQHAKAK